MGVEKHRVLGGAALSGLVLTLLLTGCSAPATSEPTPSIPIPSGTPLPDAPASVTSATTWIAYSWVSDRGPDGTFLVRPDGSDDHEILLDVPGRRLHPDFSPDGTRLAFDQQDGEADSLYVSNADGSNPQRVETCPDCAQVWEPSWSPDGTRIAVSVTSAEFGFGISIVDPVSGEITEVVSAEADSQLHFPRFSPDGTQIVYWQEKSGGEPQSAIFIVDAAGGEPEQLTDWKMIASDPSWTPDGSLIVFGTYPLLLFDSGQSELYTMKPDGGDVRQLTNFGADGPRATQPHVTPDGSAILYVRTTQEGHPRLLYAMAIDGSTDGPIGLELPGTHPVLQPEGP